ncbi:FecR family protein [Ferruginibacter sp. SUN106]|uniref:FecR family protein n=1 Tax=Ferruginibacter sp. SUN106 TaxID=2978348 RepID=UPI003D368909
MNRDRIWTLMSRKLSGEATQAELIELDDLVKIHPDTDIPVQYIHEFWSIPAESDEEFLEATFHLHSERLKEKGFDLEINKHETGSLNLDMPVESKSKKRLLWASAAVVITAAILVFTLFPGAKNTYSQEKVAQSEVSTKNGSRTKIQLPDGTSVWLNSSSKLVYDNEHFGTGIREVSLTGEAYFDVVKNPNKPFVIHTAKMDIKVLGTAFNVKCYPGEKTTETSLIRGSVEVTLKDRQEKIIMKPNEKLILNNEDVRPVKKLLSSTKQANEVEKVKPIIELGHLTLYPKDSSIVVEKGWVDGRLIFSDERLEDIAKKMERWYGVTIVITNEKLKKELLTGSFEKETFSQALNALQLTTAFNYKINKDVITISK